MLLLGVEGQTLFHHRVSLVTVGTKGAQIRRPRVVVAEALLRRRPTSHGLVRRPSSAYCRERRSRSLCCWVTARANYPLDRPDRLMFAFCLELHHGRDTSIGTSTRQEAHDLDRPHETHVFMLASGGTRSDRSHLPADMPPSWIRLPEGGLREGMMHHRRDQQGSKERDRVRRRVQHGSYFDDDAVGASAVEFGFVFNSLNHIFFGDT